MSHNRRITRTILSRFRRDRLCRDCSGPLELGREAICERCDLLKNIRGPLTMTEDGLHNLRHVVAEFTREKP